MLYEQVSSINEVPGLTPEKLTKINSYLQEIDKILNEYPIENKFNQRYSSRLDIRKTYVEKVVPIRIMEIRPQNRNSIPRFRDILEALDRKCKDIERLHDSYYYTFDFRGKRYFMGSDHTIYFICSLKKKYVSDTKSHKVSKDLQFRTLKKIYLVDKIIFDCRNYENPEYMR